MRIKITHFILTQKHGENLMLFRVNSCAPSIGSKKSSIAGANSCRSRTLSHYKFNRRLLVCFSKKKLKNTRREIDYSERGRAKKQQICVNAPLEVDGGIRASFLPYFIHSFFPPNARA